MRRIAALLASLALLATLFPAAALALPSGGARDAVIVVFKDTVANPAAAAADLGRQHAFELDFVYQHALKGFAASVPSGRVNALAHDPRVAWVEPDQPVQLYDQITPTGVQRIFADDNANIGINRTDDERVDVDIAIIDTGIDLDHPDLNVVASTNCMYSSGGPPFSRTYSCGTGGDDDNDHGTHVAGSAAALDNGIGVVGVAPGARLWAVKVLDASGSGAIGAIVAGIDYVTANAASIEVANMSLGCECSSAAMDAAIATSVDAGVTYAVAAGNSDANASTHSPANHLDVITVSALADFNGEPGGGAASTCRTDQDDTLADFSNWGSTIEIAAPGTCILSSVPGGGYDTFSGTSMASPHVAGAAALRAATAPAATPDQIRNTLIAEGNLDWSDDSGDGVKERLLDVSDASVFNPAMVGGDGGGGGGTAPVANFSGAPTSGTAPVIVQFTDSSSGSPASWAWNFGDGSAGTAQNPSHTYETAGTYTVSLTVSNSTGSDTETKSGYIVVGEPSSGGITLSATGYKVKGVKHADLTWAGATSTSVDIVRNNSKLTTTANDGAHTDNTGQKGGGTNTYRVCEAGTTNCSNEVSVSY